RRCHARDPQGNQLAHAAGVAMERYVWFDGSAAPWVEFSSLRCSRFVTTSATRRASPHIGKRCIHRPVHALDASSLAPLGALISPYHGWAFGVGLGLLVGTYAW